MAGFTTAYQRTILDTHLVAGDHIAYSTNGTSEAAILSRTPVGTWASATAANPSVKANSASLTTSAATGSGTVTHFAIYSAATAGTQKTDWTALTASKAVAAGDQLMFAPGALSVTLD